ncbi:MAG: hypothetical protein ABIG64_06150 [Candidatus Omnitrophota bacterium]
MMFQSIIIVLLLVVNLSVSGCKTFENFLSKDKEEIELSEVMPALTSEEKYYLNSWNEAAALADDTEDKQTAVFYYKKIAENFPETKEGKHALRRLEKLDKSYRDQAVETKKEKVRIKSR